MSEAKPAYVMGHTDRERRRLALQAAVLNPLTDTFLRRAGISAGMRVLELGCGIGEVSLIAARLVGPHGHVHGIDLDPAALDIARGRVRSAGHDHVTFEQIDVAHHQPAELYDAVIGRLILIHVKNALAVLRQAVALVQTGGVIAFHEGEFSWLPRPSPEMPATNFAMNCICEFFQRAVPRPNIGTQLFSLMQQAGLPPPECRAEIVMDGGPYSPVYEWIAETVISISSRFEAVGMPPLSDYDRDTLALRMRDESIQTQGVLLSPLWVGAFARKRKPS